jgi:hypothetical protein
MAQGYTSITGVVHLVEIGGTQINVALDGSLVFIGVIGSLEVYALNVRWSG